MAILLQVDRLLYRICLGVCLFCMGVITVALSAQVLARYAFNIPLQYTDDFAAISMVWMTFLGAAVLYREAGHVSIMVLPNLIGARGKAVLRIFISFMVIGALLLIAKQVHQVSPMMTRITFGSLPDIPFYSKFTALFVPLGIGSVVTIFFAINDILADTQRLAGRLPYPDAGGHGEEGSL